MKILFLTNNTEITSPLINWLNSQNETVTVFKDPINRELILKYKPDLVISYNYRHLIKQDIISFMPNRIINLHISYLPWNKGSHPNVWSFIKDTPKGVTIHLIDKGLDTGKILLQQECYFDNNAETLTSSYIHLHNLIQKIFIHNWDDIRNNRIKPVAQVGAGSFHNSKEIFLILDKLGDSFWNLPIATIKKKYY
jgi:methionyl-tRNA formyltransferase